MQRDGGPGGAGGAGNPTGGGFTGAAEALEIYGDFAAAYSGLIQVNTSDVEHLNFTSGNYLFVGTLVLTGPMKTDNVGTGGIGVAEISFNGTGMITLKVETSQEDMPAQTSMPILIPAYTEVGVTVQSESTQAGFKTSVNLVGRIYRG